VNRPSVGENDGKKVMLEFFPVLTYLFVVCSGRKVVLLHTPECKGDQHHKHNSTNDDTSDSTPTNWATLLSKQTNVCYRSIKCLLRPPHPFGGDEEREPGNEVAIAARLTELLTNYLPT